LEDVFISDELTLTLTFITKTGFIILTIWYALKVKINAFWFPFMIWISLIILLTRGNSAKNKDTV
jgi:hypothetical protein